MSTIESVKIKNLEHKQLKRALKTFNFWYKVLLETEYMNDLENRLDYQNALQTIVTHTKKKKGN